VIAAHDLSTNVGEEHFTVPDIDSFPACISLINMRMPILGHWQMYATAGDRSGPIAAFREYRCTLIGPGAQTQERDLHLSFLELAGIEDLFGNDVRHLSGLLTKFESGKSGSNERGSLG
jgi:hypothetical protein